MLFMKIENSILDHVIQLIEIVTDEKRSPFNDIKCN